MSNEGIKVDAVTDEGLFYPTPGSVIYKIMAETRSFIYEPQKDITAYELALLMPMIVNCSIPYGQYAEEYDRLPPEAKRHWIVTEAGK
ncbi:hypothetical protein G8E10_09505 [Rhizobiaceae bacterium CRRU44]|uniref:Uncharacterized protein n=1 Tax=Ferranicluibacter rubi TaxID=2715133 RepID=A0AA43ZE45_9HYPH|nr:hypothetical protein [Ferranicluibacter rubi]NHT75914.1 hypothetical protein [Ferranicluibacter rubi]NHT75974.1 hypothetical protein [Ferranicluibacter rubi]